MSIKDNVDFPFQMASFLGKPKSPLQSLDHVPPSNSSSHFHKKWPHLIKCTHLNQWVKILLLISEKVLFWVNETIAYDGHLHILKYDLPFAAQKYPCAGPGKFAKLWSISTWDLYKRRASSNASLHITKPKLSRHIKKTILANQNCNFIGALWSKHTETWFSNYQARYCSGRKCIFSHS